jgi:flagellar assembly factor FliW
MQINTTRFGDIYVDSQKVISMPDGLPGLEQFKRFTLLCIRETAPILWFQSLDATDVSLAVINPFLLFPDYTPLIPDDELLRLGAEDVKDMLFLTVVVALGDLKDITTNLLAPILINTRNNIGRQIIMENSEYTLQQPIYKQMRKLMYESLEVR